MSATVGAAIGVLAAVLALVGVHGVLAYAVGRRRREIGVRVAVGATPGVVARAVVRDGLTLTVLGLGIGVPLAAAASRTLASLMFGISPLDIVTYVVVSAFFLALGTAAGVVPARRAAAIDPATALRAD